MAAQTTDLLVVERAGALHKLTAAELTALGGGGGTSILSATVTVSPTIYNTATIAVVDAAATASTLVIAALAPNADHDADDLEDVRVTAEAVAGAINFSIHTLGAIVGDYKVLYQKG